MAAGALVALFFIPTKEQPVEKTQTQVVVTNFPAYDFARTISADTDVNIKLLLKPGVDLHNYEPTPQDIIDIKNSDIFIYNGGESEEWVGKIMAELDHDNIIIVRMMDSVDLLEEADDDILEHEDHDDDDKDDEIEYDEHIWTSPLNVIKISDSIAQAFSKHTPENTAIYQHNLEHFQQELNALDAEFRQLAESKTGTLIVADRFPFLYFTNTYGFNYLAAFPGCSDDTEASAKTITKLRKQLSKNSKKVVLHLELSNKKIAKAVAGNTKKVKLLEWHSVHNISKADFEAGKTYLDFMRQNLANLNEALDDAAPSNKS